MSNRDPRPDYYDELPQPFSEPAATQQIAGSAAPLLAGFSFALIGIIVTNSDKLRWPNLALALLVAAALLLVNAVQAGSIATRWSIEPSQWRSLLSVARAEQLSALHNAGPAALRKHNIWLIITRVTYNAGVVVLLTAVAFCLVPPECHAVSTWRVVAISLAGFGATGQMVLTAWMGIRSVLWNRKVRVTSPPPADDNSTQAR